MGIKEEMRRVLIGPIVICFVLTAIVSMSYALILAPGWISKVKTGSVDKQTNSLQNLGFTVANTVKSKFQKIANDILSLNKVFASVENNEITLPSSISAVNASDYFLNAAEIASYDDKSCLNQIPGFDLSNNRSLARAMWYVPEESQVIAYQFWDNLDPMLQQFYEDFIVAIPYMSSLIKAGYSYIYSGYQYAGVDPSQILAAYPIERNFDLYLDYQDEVISNDNGTIIYTYFNFERRPWWTNSILDSSLEDSAIFIDPYRFIYGEFGSTVCTFQTQTLEYGPVNRVLCMDYPLGTYLTPLISSIQTNLQSGYIWLTTRTNLAVLIHPNLNDIALSQSTSPTLSEVFALIATSAEVTDFMSKLNSANAYLNSANTTTNFTYTQSSETYIINIFLISIKTGASSPNKEYLLGITQKQSVVTGGFDTVISSIRQVIYIEIAILVGIILLLAVFALIMITLLSNYFSRPFEELLKYVTILQNFSEEKESEEDHETLITLSKVTESNYSREINLLFVQLSKQLRAIQLAKQALSAQNDTEAIISFSQALQLYHDLNCKRGEGIIMYNIGTLHLQAHRYQEAITCLKDSVKLANNEIQAFIAYEKKIKEKLEAKALKKASKKNINSDIESRPMSKKKKPPISLASLDLVRWALEEQLINRKFQLARTIILFAKSNPNAETLHVLWGEVVDSFNEVINNDNAMKRNPARIIISYLELANAYTEIGNYYYAEEQLNKADKKISAYEHFPTDKIDVVSSFIMPATILKQNLFYQRAILNSRMGNNQKAAELLSASLEIGRIYDPKIRKQSLLELKKIFQEAKILDQAPSINRMLDSFGQKNKDIIVLLDYSQSMGDGSRINIAVNCILKLFDKYIRANDRVGFIRFNMNCDTIFTLSEKRKNTSQLRKQFEDSVRPSGGTAFYTAILEALKLFQKAEAKNNKQWIVALTDGDDNESRVSFEQTFKKLARSDVNLIVIGLALNPALGPRLSYLCGATKGGLFIESINNESLELAFHQASDIIYGNDFNVENITV